MRVCARSPAQRRYDQGYNLSDTPNHPVSPAALEQAAAWFARIDRGGLSDQEQQAFNGWIAADPGHRRAYDKVSRTWAVMGDLVAPALPASPISAPVRGAIARPRGRRWAVAAVAAGLLIALGVGADLPQRLDANLRADAATATGEIRRVDLPDGSTVQLNTDSAIAIDFGPDGIGPRRVRLLRGEAAFEVVKNPDRPFTVAAGGGLSRVLGTVFTVRMSSRGTSVTLLEGRVAVSANSGGQETVLSPNQRVRYDASRGLGEVKAVDPQGAGAWRRGKLVFHDQPLGDVIDELNRYHTGLIRLVNEDLRAKRVNGVFDIGDPVAVVDALEAALGLSATRLTDYVILLHR